MNRIIEKRSSYISNKMNMSKKKIHFYLFLLCLCAQFLTYPQAQWSLPQSRWFGTRKNWKRVKVENFLIASILHQIHFKILWPFFISLLPLLAPYSLVSFHYPALARTCTPMFFIRAVSVPIMEVVAHAVPIKNRVMTAMRMLLPVRWFFSVRELRHWHTFKFLPILY